MKKFILVLFILSSFIFIGCEAEEEKVNTPVVSTIASVRFQNASDPVYGLYVTNGVRLGNAEYVGTIYPGEVSSSFPTEQGSYSVQILSGSSWLTATAGTFDVEGGHDYTVILRGTTTYSYWSIVQEN